MAPTIERGEEAQEFELRNGTLEYSGLAERKRVTLVVPTNLDLNLEFLSMISGQLKMDIVTRALQEFLKTKGIPDPLAKPVISWRASPTPPRSDEAKGGPSVGRARRASGGARRELAGAGR